MIRTLNLRLLACAVLSLCSCSPNGDEASRPNALIEKDAIARQAALESKSTDDIAQSYRVKLSKGKGETCVVLQANRPGSSRRCYKRVKEAWKLVSQEVSIGY